MRNEQCIGTYRPSRKSQRSLRAMRRDVWDSIVRKGGALSWLLSVWCHRAGTRRALRVFPDRMLVGMGLNRAAAAREAAKPFWVA